MNDEHHTSTLEKSELDDQALVAGVLVGNTSLFTTLVARHTDRIYGLALRLLGNSQEAEDVVQETFIRAYAHLNTFRSAASFATWLYRIALNACRDQLRRRQVRERTATCSPGSVWRGWSGSSVLRSHADAQPVRQVQQNRVENQSSFPNTAPGAQSRERVGNGGR